VILDSSALMAIVFREPGFEVLIDKIGRAKTVGIGAPTQVEAEIVAINQI
jgi:ribonuclease VapC